MRSVVGGGGRDMWEQFGGLEIKGRKEGVEMEEVKGVGSYVRKRLGGK